jgi:copper chaperone CopZ
MTHTYIVTGMTCKGCKASVEKGLMAIEQVKNVSINLETTEVNLTMTTLISTEILKQALPSKYSLSETKDNNVFAPISEEKIEKKSEFKQLFPLFLIFGYIIIGSFLMNNNQLHTESFMLDFMGLFYVVFSFFKLLDLKGFPGSFRMYDPLAKVLPAYGWVYPFMELALGILFLMRIQIPLALIITLIILGITTIGVSKALLDKKSIQCACLGTALKLPMTKATFIENSIMIVMAITVLFKTYN